MHPTPAQEQEFQAADDNGRARILIPLAKGGYHELAATLLKRYPLTGEFSANRTLYIEGLIEQGRGNLTGAVAKYRSALADDPSLTLVRADLANALAMLDEDDSAKHHLQQLMAEAKTEQEAAGIRSFMDKLDAKRPFAFNGYVSVAPSTNINEGSKVDKVYTIVEGELAEIDINRGSEAKSGVGLSAGASVGYHKRLGNDFAFVAGAGLGGQIYKDSAFNSYGGSQSVELRRIIEGGHVGLGLVGSQSVSFSKPEFVPADMDDDGIVDDGEGYYDEVRKFNVGYLSVGPRVTLQKQLTPRDRISASAVYEWRRYFHNEYANGNALLADATWTHALSSDANVGLVLGFNRVTQKDLDFNSYYAYSAGLSLYKELPYGLTIDLLGQYRYSHFDELNPLYFEKRQDHRWFGQATLTKRDINLYGFAPSLQYTYVLNNSNLANWRYDSHSVELKLTKDF